VLLREPSAHAAFQLAWIDRAFGSPVPPARVGWIRSLGFADEAFLAELGRPVERPLHGYRFEWDAGEYRKDESRAQRAAAAGLPSLAARWRRDDRGDAEDAREHLDRVRNATSHGRPATA
jgi:hypothetical protein